MLLLDGPQRTRVLFELKQLVSSTLQFWHSLHEACEATIAPNAVSDTLFRGDLLYRPYFESA